MIRRMIDFLFRRGDADENVDAHDEQIRAQTAASDRTLRKLRTATADLKSVRRVEIIARR